MRRASMNYQFGQVVSARLNSLGHLEGVLRLEDGRRVEFHERTHRQVVSVRDDALFGVRYREDSEGRFLWGIEMPGIGTKIVCSVAKSKPEATVYTATRWAYAKDWAQVMGLALWSAEGMPTLYPDTYFQTQCFDGHVEYIDPGSDLELRAVRRMAHRGSLDALPIPYDDCGQCKLEHNLLMHDTYYLMEEQFYFVVCPKGHNFEALYGSQLEKRAIAHGAFTRDRALSITQEECERCDPRGHRPGQGLGNLLTRIYAPAVSNSSTLSLAEF